MTPLMKMYTLGTDFVPPPVHAGGLRYHGMSPLLSHVIQLGLAQGLAVEQADAFEAGVLFARAEGLVPAPEASHAVAAALAEARRRTSDADACSIVIGMSGHGQLDLPAYQEYLNGTML